MELRQLTTFIRVAQLQSFSKAAESLGYSQSAVTVQIKLLEEELDARLFDRMGKKIDLTDQGRQFLEGAYQVLYEANKAKLSVVDQEELRGSLRLGTIDSLCFSKLPPILRRFREVHPRVSVRVITASPEELIGQMEHNQVDLIYILDEPRYNNNWYKLLEKKESIVFVASPGSPLAGRKGLKAEELLKEPLFLTEKDANYRRALDRYLASRRLDPLPFLESDNTEFILKMLEESPGVSFLPYYTVAERVERGRLVVLDVADFRPSMYQQIFYHKEKWKTREMDEFLRLALEL